MSSLLVNETIGTSPIQMRIVVSFPPFYDSYIYPLSFSKILLSKHGLKNFLLTVHVGRQNCTIVIYFHDFFCLRNWEICSRENKTIGLLRYIRITRGIRWLRLDLWHSLSFSPVSWASFTSIMEDQDTIAVLICFLVRHLLCSIYFPRDRRLVEVAAEIRGRCNVLCFHSVVSSFGDASDQRVRTDARAC